MIAFPGDGFDTHFITFNKFLDNTFMNKGFIASNINCFYEFRFSIYLGNSPASRSVYRFNDQWKFKSDEKIFTVLINFNELRRLHTKFNELLPHKILICGN